MPMGWRPAQLLTSQACLLLQPHKGGVVGKDLWSVIQPPAQSGAGLRAGAGCLGPHPGDNTISPRMEIPSSLLHAAGLHHSHRKEPSPNLRLEFPLLRLMPVPTGPAPGHLWEEPGSIFSSHQVAVGSERISPSLSLLPAKQAWVSASLSPRAPAPNHLSALHWAPSSLSASLTVLTPTLLPTSTPEPDTRPQTGTGHLVPFISSLAVLLSHSFPHAMPIKAPLALPAPTSPSAPPIFPSPRSSRP